MAFENNQQDAFNLRNDTESLKRLEAELDKATTAIGAAEAAAEEELAEQKLKNLVEQQKLRVKQLEQLIALEEDSIQELASLRLTLSNKQFEARKKEIQKEQQLEEKTRAKQLINENKKQNKRKKSNKKPSAVNTDEKAPSPPEDIKASSRPKITKANNKSADNNPLPDTTAESTKQGIGQTASANSREYSDDSGKMNAVELGKYESEDIIVGFENLRKYLESQSNQTVLDDLSEIIANSNTAPQWSIDFAGDLLEGIDAARKAEETLQEFRARAEENAFGRRLLLETELTNLKKSHAKAELSLRQAAITNEAKAQDLKNNKEAYALEARLARENAFAEKQNELTLKQINAEADIAFNAEHSKELMAQRLQEKQLGYLSKYQELQLEAGEYAISLEKYKKDQARKDNKAAKKEAVSGITDGLKKFGTGEFSMADVEQSYGKYMGQRTAELQADGMDESSAKLTANFELLAEAAGGLAATLDAKVKEISSMQGIVDTRLQGSQTNKRDFGNGSYWNQLLEDAKKIAGASPFIKQEKLVDNIKVLVERGISFDIKQRAFLMTIQEKIANTFDVADGTLLRLIRIQQQDTTAGRLGMESALNSFLNSMYETSEYLSEVAAGVRSSLEEMQALMDGAAATEVEFQVQKWMGSLYSVGMSKNAVDSIAQTFGQIASGDVSGLTGSGTGNLLIMAANEAGMSIADILQDGLNADETNKLMQAMVNYLAEIAESSSDSRVVQQQLASVYGVKASDLKAVTNLASSIKDISKQDLSYDGMLGQLKSMMNTIRFRTSIGEGMTNMWDNMMYSMASTQASNPMLYALPKMADLLRDVTGGGGIALPFVNVMGFGVDLNTSVADLMSVASMAGTALGSLGPLLTGIADLANPLVGSAMLSRAGINTSGKAPVIARGSAQPLQHLGGSSISESGQIVGNSSGDDVKNATLQDAEDNKKKQMVEAKDEESAVDTAAKANQAVIDIYNLLEEVAHGSQSLRVRVINNNAGGGGGSQDTPSTNNSMNSDNGNWVLSF